ncbi:uncharacterized protein LOC128727599 [Anopheles nili]|uniref:uncharacterized protein LOC128727599 n=1 Tax=Anopheles nili TaxID=185578 RepID=UPI00237ABD45|nr:uncharacterized protein LOC128727599 [Anopheles nili]
MEATPSVITVQAQYSFKGSNNDELCFKKGDVITLTQREEGGWWEGTLGDKTGWFPSNYVKEYAGPLPLSETIRPPEEIQAFRMVVLRDLLESEKAHVAELRGLVENFLEPLDESQILSINEYVQLMCNFLEVVESHEELLQSLQDCKDRVGKIFLSKATAMKKIHQSYCAAHPRAIVIVDKFCEELNAFMENRGAAKPGLLVLTTGLSKPFRRLDKYAAILQELERHMESGHPDRGDTQRSIAVYKDMASSCSATRRQKELELQILTGPVRGWQGAELSTLGEILHMGSVAVGPEHKDRYLVLFTDTLLILSVSQRMSAFKYEGKLPLTGITVNRLEDTDQLKNAFEINGSLIDRIVAVCQGPSEANRWVQLLTPRSCSITTEQQVATVDMKRNISSSAVNIPHPPPHNKKQLALDSRGYSTRVSVYSAYSGSNSQWYSINSQNFETTFPPASYPPTAPYAQLTSYFRRLFRVGKLSRFIVQALLYPEMVQKFDRHCVVMRRNRRDKATVRIQRHEKETASASALLVKSNCDNDVELLEKNIPNKQIKLTSCRTTQSRSMNNSNNSINSTSSSCTSFTCTKNCFALERQNAVECIEHEEVEEQEEENEEEEMEAEEEEEKDQDDDDAYEIITFFTGKSTAKKQSGNGEAITVYESYNSSQSTDDGSAFMYAAARRTHQNTWSIDSNGTNFNADAMPLSDSDLMNGSTAGACQLLNDCNSIDSKDIATTMTTFDVSGMTTTAVAHQHSSSGKIHTSTARLLLGDLKQQFSEQSQMSSFEHVGFVAHGLMACENLLNLDESMQIKHSLQQRMITEVRHSMPTYFVGNRFNRSSKTEIYIPSWKKDCREGALDNIDHNDITHSSSLDIPATIPVPMPDLMTAELLYNFPQSMKDEHDDMSPPPAIGNSHPVRSGSSSTVQHMSQHKRSQSFNHHLTYNQVQQQMQQQQQQHHLQQQQLKQHQPNVNLLPSLSSLSSNRPEANQPVLNQKKNPEKVNWNITNLRPAPPMRPLLLSSAAIGGGAVSAGRSATISLTGSISGATASCVGGGNSGGGNVILNASDSLANNLPLGTNSKISPTYEEDALVLRVIEAYCAAYQSSSRNTLHSGVDYDEMTPTLRQLFISVRQLQQDMVQIKQQLAEERNQRNHIQQVLVSHLETYGATNTTC